MGLTLQLLKKQIQKIGLDNFPSWEKKKKEKGNVQIISH